MTRWFLTLVVAAAASGQSFFSMRSLGETSPPADARTVGLGAPVALSYQNPGFAVRLSKTSFAGTFLTAGVLGLQAEQRRLVGSVRPAGFHAVVPTPLNTRILLGVDERFNQDFDVWSESLPDTAYRYHVIGRGGIYALRAGLAHSIHELGCVGFEYHRLLGGSREDWRFEVPGGGYASTDTVEMSYSGNALRFGASIQGDLLSAAAYYEPALRLAARSFRRVHGVVADSVADHTIGIPDVWAFAVGVQPTDALSLVVGALYRPWSHITVDNTAPEGTRNALRASAGLRLLVGKVPVRVGYSYEPWYYGAAGNQPILGQSLHLGVSVPIPEFGSVDMAAELTRRQAGEFLETGGRFLVSLSYHEAWLKRTRRWGY